MVRKNDKAGTFCAMTEMCDTKVGRKQLSSKSTEALLGRLQGFLERGKWLPMVTFSLDEDDADRCLGGVDHKQQLTIGTGKG